MSKEYEWLPESSEAFVCVAMTRLVARGLAPYGASQTFLKTMKTRNEHAAIGRVLPEDLQLVDFSVNEEDFVLHVIPIADAVHCRGCTSTRAHGHRPRAITDPPCHGAPVVLQVRAKGFFSVYP